MTYGTRRARLLALLAAGAIALGGCGGGGEDEEGDSNALVEGEEGTTTFRGAFRNVDDAPEGSGEVAGLAEMVVGKGRTTIDILVSGLTADAMYYGTLNKDSCDADEPGGGLYKFDPDGPEEDPNVVKFEMGVLKDKDTKLAAGSNANATYEKEAREEARSVVIALKREPKAKEDEKDPPQVACADLKPADEAADDTSDDGSSTGSPDAESPSPSPSSGSGSSSASEEEESPSPSPKSGKSARPSPSPSDES